MEDLAELSRRCYLSKMTELVIEWTSQVVLVVKNLTANEGDVRDVGLIPGLGRYPGGGHGNLLQYSWTEEYGILQSIGLHRVRHD